MATSWKQVKKETLNPATVGMALPAPYVEPIADRIARKDESLRKGHVESVTDRLTREKKRG